MAYTLTEAAKLSNDVLQAGVIELFVRDDPILEQLPFVDITGNGLTYNVETTEPTAAFYDVGDTWVEGTGTVTQTTAVLRILGGDADLDNFLKSTRSNINDLKAEMIAAKVKALRYKFLTTLFYGYNTGDPKEFDGLHNLINSYVAVDSSYNVVPVATNATTPVLLSVSKLEEAIDKVKGYKPDLIVMSKMMRRYINKYLLAAGGITYDDRANKRVQTLFGIPVSGSEYVKDTENCDKDFGTYFGYEPTTPAAASDASTSIFILSFGPKQFCGCQNGTITTVPLGDLETKDASRYRIRWYVSCMLQSIISCAKVTGVDPDGAVAA
jgi:hypothetical protein